MMGLLPLFCVILLGACSGGPSKATPPTALYTAKPWPSGKRLAENPKATQKDVAKYIVRGKNAYDSCTVNLDALKTLEQ